MIDDGEMRLRPGISWEYCIACGAEAWDEGKPAVITHERDCPSLTRKPVAIRCTGVDLATGTVTYTGDTNR